MAAAEPIPHYTTWAKVPADLYTRTQLGQLDPPRRIRAGVTARGFALYHGNKYAPLYAIDDTDVKPTPTPAQVASARRAGKLRYVCRWCAHVDDEPLHRRICDDCDRVVRAYGQHLEGRAHLAGLHQMPAGQPYRPLFAACEVAGYWATRIVVVDPDRDGEVVADSTLPEIRQIDRLKCSQQDVDAYMTTISDLLGDRPGVSWNESARTLHAASWDYRRWLGMSGTELTAPGMPGATGDLATDARTLAALVASVVSGTARPPSPCWVDRGITVEQLRPYATRYTTRQVVEFVDRLNAKGA